MQQTPAGDMIAPPPRMCSVCRYALVPYVPDVRGNAVHYLHPHGLHFDHAPVPTEPDATETGVCDFDSAQPAPWVVHTLPFSYTETNGLDEMEYMDDGRWGACDPCCALILAGKWDELTARSIGTGIGAPSRIRKMHSMVRRYFTGEVTRDDLA